MFFELIPPAATKEAQQEPDDFWRDSRLPWLSRFKPDTAAAESSVKSFCEKYATGGAFQAAILYAVRNESDQMFKWLDTSFATARCGPRAITVTHIFPALLQRSTFRDVVHKLRIQPPASSDEGQFFSELKRATYTKLRSPTPLRRGCSFRSRPRRSILRGFPIGQFALWSCY